VTEQQPTEQELRTAFEQQMRNVTVQEVLLQTAATLVNLAARKLQLAGDESHEKDLGQAKEAIDGARALAPLLSDQYAGQIKQALSQVQMAYAREAQTHPESQPDESGQPTPTGEQKDQATDTDKERAKARSKIWTPPGAS
jgi:hypothetical protein